MKSRAVRIYSIQINELANRRKSYTVRWKVAQRPKFSQTFVKRALADNYRSDLMHAVNEGEAFDLETGLPDSMVEQEVPVPGATWLEFARSYVEMKWPGASAKSRSSMIDALVTVTSALVTDVPGRPDADLLREALRKHELIPAARRDELSAEHLAALAWVRCATVPLASLLGPETVRAGLDAVALKLDGVAAAATTMRRKRAVFYNVLQYAVELGKLDYNPIDKVRVTSRRRKVVGLVDRRVVVNPRQARELLVVVTYVGRRGKATRGERLMAFFACLYFAALRPGEAMGLREQDCELPEMGWGVLTLEKSRPHSAKRWTDSGETTDERGLKHRGEDEPRRVPIPPELVAILRAHVKRFGVASDGRLFSSERGNVISSSGYSKVWEEARQFALTPRQASSLLAGRPYDLRHAGVSLWLNAGVQAPEVAERAGHSVDVLLKVYAKCIDGDTEIVNQRIEAALSNSF